MSKADDESLLAMWDAGMSTASIASTMGLPWTEARVVNRLAKLRDARRAGEAPPDEPPPSTTVVTGSAGRISDKRLAEILAIPDEAIDTSDIPEATEEWFARAKASAPCPNGGRCYTPTACRDRGHCGGRTVPPAPTARPSKRRVDHDEVERLYAGGKSAKAIAEQMTADGTPISDVGVRKILMRRGVTLKTKTEAQPSAASRKAVADLLALGESDDAIGRLLGITTETAARIRRELGKGPTFATGGIVEAGPPYLVGEVPTESTVRRDSALGRALADMRPLAPADAPPVVPDPPSEPFDLGDLPCPDCGSPVGSPHMAHCPEWVGSVGGDEAPRDDDVHPDQIDLEDLITAKVLLEAAAMTDEQAAVVLQQIEHAHGPESARPIVSHNTLAGGRRLHVGVDLSTGPDESAGVVVMGTGDGVDGRRPMPTACKGMTRRESAAWLVDNSDWTFAQIAETTGVTLENVQRLADGEPLPPPGRPKSKHAATSPDPAVPAPRQHVYDPPPARAAVYKPAIRAKTVRIGPVTPAKVRFARWFREARWHVDSIAALFDVDPEELSVALQAGDAP